MTRTRWTAAIGSLLVGALTLASWLLVVGPRLQQADDIYVSVADLRLQQAGLQGKIARLQALEADLPRKIEELRRLEQNFPTSAQLPELLDQIRDMAALRGVTVMALQPAVPELDQAGVADPAATQELTAEQQVAQAESGLGVGGATDGVAAMRLSLTVQGSYENLRLFLTSVETMPRSFLVDKLTVVAATTEGELSMTVEGQMFVLDDAFLVPPTSTVPGA